MCQIYNQLNAKMGRVVGFGIGGGLTTPVR